jgi:hypothetical protein
MNCAEFRDVLRELDRPATRGAAEFERAMTHAEGCGDCGVLLVEEESLDFALQKVARETGRMPGAARVEAALLKEFRQVKPEPSAVQTRRRVQWQVAALAVAAMLLLAAGTFVYQRNFVAVPYGQGASVASNQGQPVSEKKIPDVSVPDANSVTPTLGATGNLPVATQGAAAAANKATETSGAEGTEYATAYVTLPYADDPAALEGGSVVRVTMARSALESYGLPAEGMGTGDRVTADMIVSQDGTPQAIRLIAQEN